MSANVAMLREFYSFWKNSYVPRGSSFVKVLVQEFYDTPEHQLPHGVSGADGWRQYPMFGFPFLNKTRRKVLK